MQFHIKLSYSSYSHLYSSLVTLFLFPQIKQIDKHISSKVLKDHLQRLAHLPPAPSVQLPYPIRRTYITMAPIPAPAPAPGSSFSTFAAGAVLGAATASLAASGSGKPLSKRDGVILGSVLASLFGLIPLLWALLLIRSCVKKWKKRREEKRKRQKIERRRVKEATRAANMAKVKR